ncbi:MAG TPA: response regulator, partial [Burkholderiales bacterium]|nr:response regulator [Burkholderiales bacterium]
PLVTAPTLGIARNQPHDGPVMDGLAVVLIDDDEDRERLRSAFEQRGARVWTYDRAAEAMRALESLSDTEWPDVLISDLALPDQDGYSVIRRVRAIEEQRGTGPAKRMPAIALATGEDRTRALLAGFQLQLPKPVAHEELLAAVGLLTSRLA